MHLSPHSRRRTLTGPLGLLALVLASTATLGAGCKEPVLLLKVAAEARVDTFDITVTTADSHRDILLQEVGEPVDSDDPTRDISQPGSELRLALKFQEAGRYFIHLVGYSSGPPQVFTQEVEVERGENREDILLIQLAGMDGDGDGFISQAACDQLQSPSINCEYADCNDASPLVHPLAQEICDDGIDNDCIGGDAPCVDADGDGQPEGIDCNDNDPTIYFGAPEPANDCDGGPAGLCNDGIDQNCDGQDTICLADSDCDGSSDDQDCEPNNPDIFPGQTENCLNTIDDNCNQLINEGCVPCDLDGDNFERDDPDNGCIIGPGEVADCDDFDSGVHPDITASCGGNEGGSIACIAMQLCDGIDNDCDGEIDEGCESLACDADQDGYLNSSAGCNPPAGEEDCDDSDPFIYPGAPDVCEDNILQNCNTDTACDSDGDGDLYNSSVDCDDSNPNVHPGATEICNGVDDDCDGIVDEGNPDHLGTKMVDVYCNDDNDGVCGANPGPGRCVCTKVDPATQMDGSNRVICSGEDLAAAASPRCLFAPQPQPEECDLADHNCDGSNDDPLGLDLLETGDPCGTDDGECVAGVVLGCDWTVTNIGAYNEHFVCSPAFVGAIPEQCNGRDDDCDGIVPADEVDSDVDGYMACSNCAGHTLPSGIVGCDDCAPGDININPGEDDFCNGADDDCDPSTPDGVDECGGNNPDCCGSLNLCTNLATDFGHCGGCTSSACDGDTASVCTNGSCLCGTSAPCGPGQECVGTGTSAICLCNASSCPDGCCNGNSCIQFGNQNTTTCGDNGVPCFPCVDERQCTNGVCLCYGSVSPNPETFCGDGLDNDCDGDIDCLDNSCDGDPCGSNGSICILSACACSGNGGPPESTEATCDDNNDNDCDGFTDCADSNCGGHACGDDGRVCQGTSCNCSGNGGTAEPSEFSCGDGYDNDCDGNIDCADSNCNGVACDVDGQLCTGGVCVCPGGSTESNCVDGVDNDCDGNTDCDDSNCDGVACPPYNGFVCDSDANTCVCSGNGGTPESDESSCGDTFDNDCDGLTDCADIGSCNGAPCGGGQTCDATGDCT